MRNLVVVLKDARGPVSGYLASRGSHVIVPEGTQSETERNVIVLARPSHRSFAEAMKEMGLSENDAEIAAKACGLSVTIYQRQRPHATIEKPRWAEGQMANDLLPALLAGRWSADSPYDRELVRRLFDFPDYDNVEKVLRELLWIEEAPLQRVGNMWALTAPADAFQMVARRLTTAHLERFEKAFREVFDRLDPRLEIPIEQWLYQDIRGEHQASAWLRTGMAEAALLIATRGADAHLIEPSSPQEFVDHLVRGLPGLADDWRVLASVRDEFPRLMEAAPSPLLGSLEHLLEARPEDAPHLFQEGKDGFSAFPLHTGLLWGLETLAWSPVYLPRVSLILARLASMDPGGRTLNRPINSLREIFLWWHPGTFARTKERLAALDGILTREPTVGWKLLADLIHPGPSVSHPTAKPRWRDFGDVAAEELTKGSAFGYLSAIVDRALDRAGVDPERWEVLLRALSAMTPLQRRKCIQLLGESAAADLADEARIAFWSLIRDFTHRQRAFADAVWALPNDVIAQLEAILPSLAPADSVERNRWLFDDWWPQLAVKVRSTEVTQSQLDALRQGAAEETFLAEGSQGLLRLAISSRFPSLVASASMPLLKTTSDIYNLLIEAVAAGQPGVQFASQLSAHAERLLGRPWRDLVLRHAREGAWPPAVTAALMMWWTDLKATWRDIDSLGDEVSDKYWREMPVFQIESDKDAAAYQIERLLSVGRASEVFRRLAAGPSDMSSATLLKVFDRTVQQLVEVTSAAEASKTGLDSYTILEFLNQLRTHTDISRDEIARREYQILPLLSPINIGSLTIHDLMAEDPAFFVQILCDVFLPAHRDKEQVSPANAEDAARARIGFNLLTSMSRLPGQQTDGEISSDILSRWIEDVRGKAAEVDRAAVADTQIGEILAHAPADKSDEAWPHTAVRTAIELFSSRDIDRGLIIGRYNMRGVVSRDLYEGGVQERELATQYRRWAETLRLRWPRMASVLDEMATEWESDGKREDIRAEQEKLSSH